MTEKRYDIEYDSNCYMCIVDCEKKVLYTDRKKIVKLLNEQNETITEQSSQIESLKDENRRLKKQLIHLILLLLI